MHRNVTIAFVGAGNMARALIGGLLAAGTARENLLAMDAKPEMLEALDAAFGVQPLRAGADPVDALIVAVKPVDVEQALADARAFIGADTLVLSIAAGIPIRVLERWLPAGTAVVRAMPNTPALIGAGISGAFATANTSPTQREVAAHILLAAGELVWVDQEDSLDAVTAVSGSGPAYVFYLIEALEEAAMAEGLLPGEARRLALATCAGASRLAIQSSEPPARLREQVTSKGGTTAAALASLKDDGFLEMVQRAVHSARLRARAMGEEYGAS